MTRPLIRLCRRACVAALFLASVYIVQSEETTPAKMEKLRLYIPIPELENRVGTDVEPLAAYVKALEKTAAAFLQKEGRPQAKGLLIAVGLLAVRKRKSGVRRSTGIALVKFLPSSKICLRKWNQSL